MAATLIGIPSNSSRLQMPKPDLRSETRPVELRVELPLAIAAEVAEVQREDPEVLSRILLYGLTRRAIFDGLSRGDRSSELLRTP